MEKQIGNNLNIIDYTCNLNQYLKQIKNCGIDSYYSFHYLLFDFLTETLSGQVEEHDK